MIMASFNIKNETNTTGQAEHGQEPFHKTLQDELISYLVLFLLSFFLTIWIALKQILSEKCDTRDDTSDDTSLDTNTRGKRTNDRNETDSPISSNLHPIVRGERKTLDSPHVDRQLLVFYLQNHMATPCKQM